MKNYLVNFDTTIDNEINFKFEREAEINPEIMKNFMILDSSVYSKNNDLSGPGKMTAQNYVNGMERRLIGEKILIMDYGVRDSDQKTKVVRVIENDTKMKIVEIFEYFMEQ